ncbi:MAG: HAD-IG family 5'-nucleotidase [Ardenticatenales bacterium]
MNESEIELPATPLDGTAPDALDGAIGLPSVERRVFCNRTLNLRKIRAIGYDMDYTLVHYNVEAWERAAYEHMQRKLIARGWPVEHLRFDPSVVIRGLMVDRELGNLIKANRFGYVKHASHGLRRLSTIEKNRLYARTVVSPGDARYRLLDTLFSISEGVMFAQATELLDARLLPEVMGFVELYDAVRGALDRAHIEGELKAEIMAHPERYVELDPAVPMTLREQQLAGHALVLITNSDFAYTRFMMAYAFDRFLPAGTTWRDLFRLVIVSARKPEFFGNDRLPIFEVVTEDGLLRTCPSGITSDGVYVGGHAAMVERHLGLDGSDILYIGDHMYGDVTVSKAVRRWRTALILRELEDEIVALSAFRSDQRTLMGRVAQKERLEHELSVLRLRLQDARAAAGLPAATLGSLGRRTSGDEAAAPPAIAAREAELKALRARIVALDATIDPLAHAAEQIGNVRWGPTMRTGADKSYLARQLERHADIYTARVSNFRLATPFAYFRAPYGSLPHDPGPGSGGDLE